MLCFKCSGECDICSYQEAFALLRNSIDGSLHQRWIHPDPKESQVLTSTKCGRWSSLDRGFLFSKGGDFIEMQITTIPINK